MSDLYARVVPEEQRNKRKKGKITAILALALVLLTVLGLFIYRMVSYRHRVWDFEIALSSSTVYAYENNSLRADVEGVSIRVSGEHNYSIYNYLCVRSVGTMPFRLPKEQAPVRLSYGDGAVLELWPGRSNREMYIRFTDPAGKVFRFHSTNMYLGDMLYRYLSPEQNEPWQ